MKTEDLIDVLARDIGTGPARPEHGLARWLPLALIASGGLFLITFGIRTDFGAPEMQGPTLLKMALGLLLAMTAGLGALALSRPTTALPRALTALALVLGFVVAVLALDPSWRDEPMAGVRSILRCLTLIPVVALLPLVALLFALREGAVMRPAAAGALAGLAAAGLAIVLYSLNCDEDGTLFISLWYPGAALITAAIGALAGRRLLVW
jgi:hypothetical protein